MKDPLNHLNHEKKQGKNFEHTQITTFQKVTAFFLQFKRFGWDLLGLLFFLVTVITLLGLLGVSRGALINPWVRLLERYFGWGSYGIVLTLGFLGWAAFRHSAGKPFPLSLGKVLAIEGSFFALLGSLSVFGGFSLERAEAGKDGGILGWGLSKLLPDILSAILLPLLFLVFLAISLGIFSLTLKRIASWGTQEPQKTNTVSISESIPTRKRTETHDGSASKNVDLVLQNEGKGSQLLPPLNLLMREHHAPPDQAQITKKARTIENTLAEFGLPARVIGYRVGPTVTQFALEPGYVTRSGPDGQPVKQKVRVSQISSLNRDLTLRLSASRLRIETPVPGRPYVGIEVPNDGSNVVRLRPILESVEFRSMNSPLGLGLGRNVSGEVIVADLEKMPHLLIAGTTNSGKSVCITAIASCLVMNNAPRDLKLVLLDPKMVELIRFNGLPHVLGKVETELERMLAVLRWALAEMDARYRLLAEAKTRNIESYNRKMLQKKQPNLPRIVIIIDELADLMMSAPDQTEHSLTRLAQMARATGMHLVVATQRPSTDVVTGLIKANFPARISFAVASSVDSRVILDAQGAETLLGKGDMLYLDPAKSGLQRIQGILLNDSEIEKVVHHWQRVSSEVEKTEAPWEPMTVETQLETSDQLVEQAIGVVKAAGKASVSLLQRRLRIGYPRAARLIDELEDLGIVGPSQGSGKDREVLTAYDQEDDEINNL